MRTWSVFVLAVAGCYAPTAIEGAPCGPGAACPSGLSCDPTSARCVREPSLADAALGDGMLTDAPVDAPVDALAGDAAVTGFLDTFSRGDSAAIGNGWIEKNPAAFSITDGEVTRIDTFPVSYRDNLVYRPPTENVRDVEISIDVRFTAMPVRFAQIFVRGRTATISGIDSYDGYLLYVEGEPEATTTVILGRQLGGAFVETLAPITLTEPLTTTNRYRMTLRAEGGAPVALTARVDRLTASSTTTIGSAFVEDAAPNRITDAGTVGFAGDEFPRYVYDDFRRTAL